MKKKCAIGLFWFVFNLIVSSAVFAWDDTGHKVTAFIAWQQMTTETRAKTAKLLLNAPEDSHLSVYYPSGSRSVSAKELEHFMIASTWSDIVRNRDFKVRYEKYHRGPWHYADIFWKQLEGKAQIMENRSEGLAIEKLYDFEKTLKNDSVSNAEKAISLAWFLHVVGDIHNPLHNASRITEIEPEGDQGGNLFLLSSPEKDGGARLNLHSFWDSVLTRNIQRDGDACDSDYIQSIAAKIIKKHPFPKMKNRLRLANYKDWNQEAFKLLNQIVYPNELKRGEMPSKQYQSHAFIKGQEQIALAGYRLGEMLNLIFSKSKEKGIS